MAASLLTALPGYFFDGAVRTLDGLRRGFMAEYPREEDPPPATPYEVIYEGGKLSLRYYRATGSHHCSTPLLLIPALIKRPFIVDLQPNRSLIRVLTGAGLDVYLTDWIPPGPEDTWRGFDAYVNQDLVAGVREVKAHSGAAQVSIIGYCFGGLLSAIYTALHPQTVKNLVPIAIPLDLSVRELPSSAMVDHLTPAMVDLMLETYGNMPALLINSGFNSLAPLHHLFDKYVGLYRSRDREGFAETFNLFEKWMNSDVPMAGQIFREMTIDLGQNNRLAKGEFEVGGRLVDLKRITCPVLNLVGELDDVVHPRSSTPLVDLVASEDKRNLLFPTGHMGASVSSSALRKLWPQVTAWLEEHDA